MRLSDVFGNKPALLKQVAERYTAFVLDPIAVLIQYAGVISSGKHFGHRSGGRGMGRGQSRGLRGGGVIGLILVAVLAVVGTGCAGGGKVGGTAGYSGMFGNFAELGADWNPPGPAEIVAVSFDLPVDAYVYVSSSGEVTFVRGETARSGTAQLWITVDDKNRRADWDTYRFHEGGFSVSAMYKLKAGHHTAYLMGSTEGGNYNFGYMSANIVAIATQNGRMSNGGWFGQE